MNNQQYLIDLHELLEQNNKSHIYINACLAYASRLLSSNLPVIFDNNHLSLLLGLDKSDLGKFLALADENCYSEINILKRSGGYRQLSVPSKNLKRIQKWIQINILDNLPVSKVAMGFYKDRSIVTNALEHVGKDCLINIDIKDFFPSINFDKVFMVFKYYGYTKEVSYCLAKLCTYLNVLPQGSPASPAISNQICLKLDKRLEKLADTFHASYTRYADDITLSGEKSIRNMLDLVIQIVCEEGFAVNIKKTRIAYKHQRQEVTGLIVNSGKVKVSREYKRFFRNEIYYCQKYGVSNHQKKVGDIHSFYKEHMYGKAYFINMVEPQLGKQLLEQLDSITWEY